MKSTLSENYDSFPNLSDRTKSLATFEKLELAMRLIEEATVEYPRLKELEIEPMMKSLLEGMHIFSAKNSELDLRALMIKHEWRVGQRFYDIRVTAKTDP